MVDGSKQGREKTGLCWLDRNDGEEGFGGGSK